MTIIQDRRNFIGVKTPIDPRDERDRVVQVLDGVPRDADRTSEAEWLAIAIIDGLRDQDVRPIVATLTTTDVEILAEHLSHYAALRGQRHHVDGVHLGMDISKPEVGRLKAKIKRLKKAARA
jgi:hypothetical protein